MAVRLGTAPGTSLRRDSFLGGGQDCVRPAIQRHRRRTPMSIVSTTTTINAAFLQEIKEDHRELWQLLAEAEAWCRQHAGHSVRQAVDVFTKLRDQLGMHFAL